MAYSVERYYIRSRGRVEGPFTIARLRELAQRGKFGRFHHVSTDRQTWERASAHPELFPEAGIKKARNSASGSGSDDFDDTKDDASLFDNMTVDSNSEHRDWFYTQGGEQVDQAVGFAELKQLAASGQLAELDFVWTEGMDEWLHAEKVIPHAYAVADSPIKRNGDNHSDATATTNASLALASLVMGILGMTALPLLGSIFAVVFGHIAINQIKRSVSIDRPLAGSGLAIAGLILGYLMLGLSAIIGIVVICLALFGSVAVR